MVSELPILIGTSAPQHGWILVLVGHTHLRGLLLRVLNLAGYAVLGCATLSEAEEALRLALAAAFGAPSAGG